MALDKPYTDVPGTIIFDAEQSHGLLERRQTCASGNPFGLQLERH